MVSDRTTKTKKYISKQINGFITNYLFCELLQTEKPRKGDLIGHRVKQLYRRNKRNQEK